MYFCGVKATLTELRRDTGRILGSVIYGKETVELTQHGQTVAEIRPRVQGMPAKEFARLWRARKPLGRETAEAVAAALKDLDAADLESRQ
jgi:antitoxin (DNA-binding transcriptional repressor) of toxin-antitoxin stability system